MKKTVSLLLILILCLSMFAGCSSKNDTLVTSPDSSPSPSPAESIDTEPEDLEEEYGIVVIQNGDRTLTFTEMPQKVLCCHLYAAENMVMLGLEDYIAGKNVPTNASEVPLEELAGKFENIPEIERSHENAIALEADLVIGQVSAFRDTNWGTYEMFEDKGVSCYTISGTLAEDETIEHVYEDIRALGQIFKVEHRAEALVAEIQTKIDAVQAVVKDIPEAERVCVFVMDSFNGNEIYTTSAGLQSNLIELAGGINCTRNMADSRWFNTSVETLVDTNPDIIIINDYGSQTVEEKLDFLNSNPALADVPAVKNQAYIIIPLTAVMQDVRAASTCETFAQEFYTELFSDEH
ncbi:MAG: ABC transporter substrate-binding protein [Lachnospiraceae bacterium]